MLPRRKPKAKRYAAFEVAGSTLHLIVLEDGGATAQSQVRTRSVVWRQESRPLDGERGQHELSAALRTLLDQEQLGTTKVQFALGGDHCVTRVVTGTKEQVRMDLVGLEERSTLYLGLGPGPKSVAAIVHSIDARHDHGALTAANTRTLDALAAAARNAGLSVERIESSIVGLSRLVGHTGGDSEGPALILLVSSSGVEAGISYRGRLLLQHRLRGFSTTSDWSQFESKYLGRLQRYCDRYYGHTEGRIHRVFLFGPNDLVRPAHEGIHRAGTIQAEVLDAASLGQRWGFRDIESANECCAALGAALAAALPDTAGSGPNLMDQRDAAERAVALSALARFLAPAAAALLLTLTLAGLRLYEKTQCADLNAQHALTDTGTFSPQQLWARIVQADAMIAQHEAIQQKLGRADWAATLTNLAQCMPGEVWLTRFQLDPTGRVSLAGVAAAENSVYELMSWLEKAPDWERVVLVGTRPSRGSSNASIEFEVECAYVGKTARPVKAKHGDARDHSKMAALAK